MVFEAFVDLVLDCCTGVNSIPSAQTGNRVLSNARSVLYEIEISYEQNESAAVCVLSQSCESLGTLMPLTCKYVV